MKLSICIEQFFGQYLPQIKGVSEHTIKTYRDTFTLFLPFAANRLCIKINSLEMEDLSSDLILEFLEYLEKQRHNTARSRNLRLAAIKSFAQMVRFMYPQKRDIAERILYLPNKRSQKNLVGFLIHEEIIKVFEAVNIQAKEGPRDYALLHLLYDSGARATEIAILNIGSFDPSNKTLTILGKGNCYRLIELWPKTAELINLYIKKYRTTPKPIYRHRLFINQRAEEFTRHGIYRICKKYLSLALPENRIKTLNPAHSFRHSCAVNMLLSGYSITDIKNRLGHENIQSTMVYLHLDLSRRREVQKRFIKYTQSLLTSDPKIEKLIDWDNKEQTLAWLDSL